MPTAHLHDTPGSPAAGWAAWLPTFSLQTPPPGFVDHPYPFYAALRQHAPLHRLPSGGVLLTRHADVLAVYRSPHTSSDKRAEFAPRMQASSLIYEHHTHSLVFNDPPLHTRVRRILMGALNQRTVARLQADVQALVQRLLDRLATLPAPCVVEDFAACIPVEVIGNLLNMPHSMRPPLRAWSLAILSALEPAPSAAVLATANTAVADFCRCLRELVTHRRQHPGDPQTDVLTRLIQGDAEGSLSEAELLHNCIFLLNAGHETTANLVGNSVHSLLQQPVALAQLVGALAAPVAPQAAAHTTDGPPLLQTAIEELLRFESPLQLNNRLATADLQLPSGSVAAGTYITLALGAANRDPAAFDQPDALNLARKPNNHVAFGQGMHACSGMNVARLEARLAIAGLLARFPDLQPAGPALRDPRVRFRGLQRLPVSLGKLAPTPQTLAFDTKPCP
jgi:cytochrome P450